MAKKKTPKERRVKEVSLREADIRREWAEMEGIVHKDVPPQVKPDDNDLNDLFNWGKWVARKANITKAESKGLLSFLRQAKRK